MGTPQILSVFVIYPAGQSAVAPGETAEVVVEAVDSDNYTITVTLDVTNPREGGETVVQSQAVIVADGLAYAGTAAAPEGQPQPTITQHPTERNRFFITAG
jgi:hypothetical protein